MENKVCKQCGNDFVVTDEDLAFLDKVSPEFGPSSREATDGRGKKYLIPAPTLCPGCREQRRLAWRNERHLYKRSCDLCGQAVLSIYSPDKKYTVYCADCWWSDKWDPLEYRQDFDLGKSFWVQFKELMSRVPQLALMNVSCENSDYTNQSYADKNCYMTFATDLSEDCYYVDYSFSCKNCVDGLGLKECEYCYQCVDCTKCYQNYFCQDGSDCQDCYFSYALKNCHHCFGCTNLRHKEYYYFNQPLSPAEWQRKVEGWSLTSDMIKESYQWAKEVGLAEPRIYATMNNCENCSGNYLNNCKNARHCFDGANLEDAKYCILTPVASRDIYDVSGGAGERIYESFSAGAVGRNLLFCGWCWTGVVDLTYCILCMNNSHDLFGCVGLKKKNYCVLNKQYTKADYQKLVTRIVEQMQQAGDWGEFFPLSLAPFGYNEAIANEYYPLSRDEAIKLGATWQDEDYGLQYSGSYYQPKEIKNYDPKLNVAADKEIEACLAGILSCDISGRPYKIMAQELAWYIEHNLPIPRRHPEVRYLDRMAMRNPRRLWKRQCMCEGNSVNSEQLTSNSGKCEHEGRCNNMFETTYSQDREEKVYCEECYRKSIL